MVCEFSLSHYGECIDIAKEQNYTMGRIMDWSAFAQDCEKYLLLRHDVDFFPQYALDMALLENQKHVKSTYYFLLHSEFYNALSPANIKIIKEISNLNFEIGWHVHSNYMLEGEEKLLQEITGKPMFSFSHHFPTLHPKPKVDHTYLNARSLDIDNIKYISDSCRNWREGCFCSNLGKYNKLEVLTHPIWYVHETNMRDDAINKMRYDLRKEVDDNVEGFKLQIPQYLEDISRNEK